MKLVVKPVRAPDVRHVDVGGPVVNDATDIDYVARLRALLRCPFSLPHFPQWKARFLQHDAHYDYIDDLYVPTSLLNLSQDAVQKPYFRREWSAKPCTGSELILRVNSCSLRQHPRSQVLAQAAADPSAASEKYQCWLK